MCAKVGSAENKAMRAYEKTTFDEAGASADRERQALRDIWVEKKTKYDLLLTCITTQKGEAVPKKTKCDV